MQAHVHAFPGGIGNRRIRLGYNLWFVSHPSSECKTIFSMASPVSFQMTHLKRELIYGHRGFRCAFWPAFRVFWERAAQNDWIWVFNNKETKQKKGRGRSRQANVAKIPLKLNGQTEKIFRPLLASPRLGTKGTDLLKISGTSLSCLVHQTILLHIYQNMLQVQ